MSATKERPILFARDMVSAILAHRKTQTRRPLKGHQEDIFFAARQKKAEAQQNTNKCPYGAPGDLLWVRETWAADKIYNNIPPRQIPPDAKIRYLATDPGYSALWRSSIHMPRWASRITLHISDVQATHLQDISEADAKAEGADNVEDFKRIWTMIYGADAWDDNPLVWVVSFDCMEGQS